MNNMEFNKLFAAVLVAGIIAALSGFIASQLVPEPHETTEFSYIIAEAEAGTGGGSAVAMPEPILAMIGTADIERGKQVAKACAACHNFEPGGPNGTGPALAGVVGNAKASHAGFAYSEAMKAKGGNWSYSELNHFLWKPKAYVKGTAMNFIGVKKPEDRAALIAYLRSISGNPGLPSAADIEAEAAELGPKPAEVTPADTAPSEPAQH
jgi:cytochrome c